MVGEWSLCCADHQRCESPRITGPWCRVAVALYYAITIKRQTEATNSAQPASLTYSYTDLPACPNHLYHLSLRGQDPSSAYYGRLTLNYFLLLGGSVGRATQGEGEKIIRATRNKGSLFGGDKNGSKSRYATGHLQVAAQRNAQHSTARAHSTRRSGSILLFPLPLFFDRLTPCISSYTMH